MTFGKKVGRRNGAISVTDIHSDTVVVDCHNDWILLLERERGLGNKDSLERRFLPQFRAGGVDVQVTPVYIDEEFLPESALRRSLLLIEHLKEEVEATSDHVALCLSGAEIDDAVEARKVALVLALEGSHAVGSSIELFRTMFELGVRMASFSWMDNTALAGGSRDGDPGTGLSKSGLEALQTLERLGIVMDISHLSARSVDDVLEHANRPLVASHSSARALRDHHRNLHDEHVKGIAAIGGVIGVTAIPFFTDPDQPVIDRVVDHMLHIADTAGIDHVGIGSDFMKEWVDETYGDHPAITDEGEDLRTTIGGWETAADMPMLTEALERRGFRQDEIVKILGENFLRVFREVMGRPVGTE